MKSTKRILSAILALCMVFGCFAVGFTAQATSADLQAAIDANYGDKLLWKGGNVTVDETIVINGDIDIDFNNAVLTGAEGISVLNVKGGKVNLFNGTFIANSKSYSGETGFIKSLMAYRPAVSVNGGDVTFDCITAVGSLIRIPNSGTIEVTSGNGINANSGKVTIKDSIAVGMKALDNTKASVVIEDALLVGIYKAINDVSKVTYADGYKRYETIDFVKALLADGVTLTPGEEKYGAALTNSQGDFSFGSVIATVKAPEFAPVASEYADGELTLTAATGAADEDKAGVPNRYSYDYLPVSATVDGVKAEFEKVDGVYTAKLAAKANTTYNVETEYKLSLKLGKQQKEVVENALDTVAKYAEKAPELLYRFVEDFEAVRDEAMEYATFFYNAKYATGVGADEIKAYFTGEAMNKLYAVVLALVGQTYDGWKDLPSDTRAYFYQYQSNVPILKRAFGDADKTGDYKSAYQAGAAYDADQLLAGSEPFFKDTTGTIYYKHDEETGAGVGLITQFNEYYAKAKELIYGGSTTEFADPAAAAAYLAENWEDIYAMVEAAIVLVDEIVVLLNDEEVVADLQGLLSKLLGNTSVESAVGLLNTGKNYLDKVTSRLDKEQIAAFAGEYGDKLPSKCYEYTKKFMDIAYNPDKYFDVVVNGDFVNLISFTETQEITTAAEKPVLVEVTVGNGGSVDFNGDLYSTATSKYFDYNEAISIVPTAAPGYKFSRIVVNAGGAVTVVDGETYTAKAATNTKIEVIFVPEVTTEDSEVEIVFMTDKTLGFKYLGSETITAAKFAIKGEGMLSDYSALAPAFKGTEYLGLDKDVAAISAEIAAGEDVIFVSAQYKADETVNRPAQDEAIKMTDATKENGKAYFEATISVPDGYKAIEAGIIATKKADLATEANMTTALSGTSGVAFGRVDNKDADGYIVSRVVYTLGVKATGTVYARGYIVLVDDAGNTTIEYTEIVNVTL